MLSEFRRRAHHRCPSPWLARPPCKQPQVPNGSKCHIALRRDIPLRPIAPLVWSPTCRPTKTQRDGQPRPCNEQETAHCKFQHHLSMVVFADRPAPSHIKPLVSSPYWRPAHLDGDPVLDAIDGELIKLHAIYQHMQEDRQVRAAHSWSASTERPKT